MGLLLWYYDNQSESSKIGQTIIRLLLWYSDNQSQNSISQSHFYYGIKTANHMRVFHNGTIIMISRQPITERYFTMGLLLWYYDSQSQNGISQ